MRKPSHLAKYAPRAGQAKRDTGPDLGAHTKMKLLSVTLAAQEAFGHAKFNLDHFTSVRSMSPQGQTVLPVTSLKSSL